jgi:hypothetical protein
MLPRRLVPVALDVFCLRAWIGSGSRVRGEQMRQRARIDPALMFVRTLLLRLIEFDVLLAIRTKIERRVVHIR